MTAEEFTNIQTRFAKVLVCLQHKPASFFQQEIQSILDSIYRDYRNNPHPPEQMLFVPTMLRDPGRRLRNELDAARHPLATILGPNRYEMVRELIVVSGFPRRMLHSDQMTASWARRLIADFDEVKWADSLTQNGRSTRDLLLGTNPIWPDPDPLGGEPPPTPDPRPDKWLDRARKLCEAAIDEFVDDFLETPYRHRVEHSLHCMLFTAIASHVHFQGEYSMADGTRTQLVHKEWPETVARPGKRRGNFDVAILAPGRIREAHLADFKEGRIVPSLIIEVGLDYDDTHFEDDRGKLANSLAQEEGIEQGYLIHFLREKDDSQAILGVLREPGHERISTAYARVHGGTKRRKLLSEAEPRDIP